MPDIQDTWINEIHYDNAGGDVGEFVEIATTLPSLDGWTVLLYNGSNGTVYRTIESADLTAGETADGISYFTWDQGSIQNGAPDGIALVDAGGAVVEFISYEGELTATTGAAAGLTSTDIGVAEGSSTPVGFSIARVVEDGQPAGWNAPTFNTFGAPNTPADPDPIALEIYEIQGAGLRSDFEGELVITSGIVTAVKSDRDDEDSGFYIQAVTGDGDIATSDAVFVFTEARSDVQVGDLVEITGIVDERQFGRDQPTTRIVETETSVISSGNALPDAVVLGEDRTPPTESIDDNPLTFDPVADGLDFWESLEGMRVTAPELDVVGATNRFFEIFTVLPGEGDATGLSDRGTLNISPDDFNPERIQVQSDFDIFREFTPRVDAGDQLLDVTGVVSYSFGNYEIIVTESYDEVFNGLEAETTDLTGSLTELTVASYNVLNLDPRVEDRDLTNNQESRNVDDDLGDGRFDAIAEDILFNLGAPDIIALQEVQDNTGGETGDGVIAADETLQLLIDTMDMMDDGELNGSTGYAYLDNPFITDLASGGQPGGNIRTAYLYNTDRVDFVEGSLGTIGGQEPGEAFDGARLPLTATFEFNGQEVDVVNVHLSSKGGSAPLMGTEQPFEELQENPGVNGSLDERQAQATQVSYYVEALLAEDPDANVIVLGDFNEFEFISPLLLLEDAGLENLTNRLDADERYSFVFQGNSQALDHILVSDNLADSAEYAIVHVNTEFATTRSTASDHDPVISRFEILPEDSFEVSFGTKPGFFANGKAQITGEVWSIEDDAFVTTAINDKAPIGLLRKVVDLDAADVEISSSVGSGQGKGKGQKSWVSNSDGAIGVRSSGENGKKADAFLLDGSEKLIFDFTDGDATEVEFDFAQTDGRVRVEAFDDGISLGSVALDLGDGMLSLGFEDGADRVVLQALGDGLSVEGFTYERLFDDVDQLV